MRLGVSLKPRGGPALALDLTAALDSRMSFTRSTSGTRFNSSGSLELITNSLPRFDHDPVTLATRGLLIEDARTNLLLNSLLNGTNLATQDVAVTAQSYALSFYGTGSITLTGAHAASVNGTGAFPTRTTLIFTPTAGTLTVTVAGTVQYAQLEAGAFQTSFIPTAGATVLRGAEAVSISPSGWLNTAAGTYIVQAMTPATTGTFGILSHDDSASKRVIYVQNSTARSFDGVGAVTAVGAASGAMVKIASAWDASGRDVVVGGGAVATGTTAAGFGTASTTVNLGIFGGGNRLNGWVKSLTFYAARFPAASLQAMTAG